MSKGVSFATALLLLTLAGCSALKEYRSPEGRFTVRFPAGSNPQTSRAPLPDQIAGPLTMDRVESRSGDLFYVVEYWDYPEDFLKKNDAESILNRIVSLEKPFMKDNQYFKDAILLTENQSGIDGIPGRAIDFGYGKDADQAYLWIIKIRYYLLNQRMYYVVVDGLKEHAVQMDEFISSFKISGG